MLTWRPGSQLTPQNPSPASKKNKLVSLFTVCDGVWRAVGGAPTEATDLFLSAPRFPERRGPVRRAVRQAALATFLRSSTATTAGPSLPLPLIYCRWMARRALPSFFINPSDFVGSPLPTVVAFKKNLKEINPYIHMAHEACKVRFTRRSLLFLCYKTPPTVEGCTIQRLWLDRVTDRHN